jgi:hypothetical protein
MQEHVVTLGEPQEPQRNYRTNRIGDMETPKQQDKDQSPAPAKAV